MTQSLGVYSSVHVDVYCLPYYDRATSSEAKRRLKSWRIHRVDDCLCLETQFETVDSCEVILNVYVLNVQSDQKCSMKR